MHLRMHSCIAVKWIPPRRRGSTMGIHFEYSNKREASYVSQTFFTRITYPVAWMILQKARKHAVMSPMFLHAQTYLKINIASIDNWIWYRKRYQNSLLSLLSLEIKSLPRDQYLWIPRPWNLHSLLIQIARHTKAMASHVDGERLDERSRISVTRRHGGWVSWRLAGSTYHGVNHVSADITCLALGNCWK